MFFTFNYTKLSLGDKPVNNPLKGLAPLASETEYETEVSLVYAIVNWSEIEAVEGIYDFETFEKNNHFEKWMSEGKRIILRVMCDKPNDTGELMIPTWLYDKTKDGQWYEVSYGKGYSPNYANPVFIEAHQSFIEALAQRYDSNPYVLCVQLGSLGHWGEWHIHDDLESKFPKQDIANQYVMHYVNSFKETLLQMRRPYPLAKKYGMGLFNDVFGYEKGTERWLDWINEGYVSDQSDEAMPSMQDVFKYGYIGGEIASYESMEYYFSDGFSSMLEQLKDSHMSFVGPNSPIWIEGYDEEIDRLKQELGYCLGITQVGTRKIGSKLHLSLQLTNLNTAPMAQNWELRIYVYNEQGIAVSTQDIDARLNEYFETKAVKAWVTIPNEKYSIGIGIIDPTTDKASVELANIDMIEDKVYLVYKSY